MTDNYDDRLVWLIERYFAAVNLRNAILEITPADALDDACYDAIACVPLLERKINASRARTLEGLARKLAFAADVYAHRDDPLQFAGGGGDEALASVFRDALRHCGGECIRRPGPTIDPTRAPNVNYGGNG